MKTKFNILWSFIYKTTMLSLVLTGGSILLGIGVCSYYQKPFYLGSQIDNLSNLMMPKTAGAILLPITMACLIFYLSLEFIKAVKLFKQWKQK